MLLSFDKKAGLSCLLICSAECGGDTSLPKCCNRLLRQQCIPSGADSEKHAGPGSKAITEDPQPVPLEIPGKAPGKPSISCLSSHIKVPATFMVLSLLSGAQDCAL